MPLSHSHQFLCVSLRFCDTVVSSAGFAGSVTFQIWCAWLPKVRRRYTLLLSPLGSCDPSHTRTICAPPASARPGSPGMCDRRSEEHTSELQSRGHLVCRLLLEKKKK